MKTTATIIAATALLVSAFAVPAQASETETLGRVVLDDPRLIKPVDRVVKTPVVLPDPRPLERKPVSRIVFPGPIGAYR